MADVARRVSRHVHVDGPAAGLAGPAPRRHGQLRGQGALSIKGKRAPAAFRRWRRAAAYNRAMFQTLTAVLAPAVLERLTLVFNHVLGAEPVAGERLRPHAGRTIVFRLEGWPSLLPPAPPLAWCVTPAGLLEWGGLSPDDAAALQVHVDASNPALLFARLMVGERPAVRIEGDAALAADVGWLLENLRWDVAADLERLFGRAVAQQLHQIGVAVGGALRAGLKAVGPLVERWGPGPGR